MIMREKEKKRNERKKMKKKIQESASKLLSANTYIQITFQSKVQAE